MEEKINKIVQKRLNYDSKPLPEQSYSYKEMVQEAYALGMEEAKRRALLSLPKIEGRTTNEYRQGFADSREQALLAIGEIK